MGLKVNCCAVVKGIMKEQATSSSLLTVLHIATTISLFSASFETTKRITSHPSANHLSCVVFCIMSYKFVCQGFRKLLPQPLQEFAYEFNQLIFKTDDRFGTEVKLSLRSSIAQKLSLRYDSGCSLNLFNYAPP